MPVHQEKRKKTRNGPWSVKRAMDSLVATSESIQYRDRVRPSEAERIRDAVALAMEPNPPESETSTRREKYWEFLRRINRLCGAGIVMLCAAGLGQSAIGIMKERVRIDLVAKIKQRETELKPSVLSAIYERNYIQGIVILPPKLRQSRLNIRESSGRHDVTHSNEVSRTGDVYELTIEDTRTRHHVTHSNEEVSLTGDVYELTIEDARTIAMSDQIGGGIWLTDSYDANTASFITIPISDELKTQFIIQRPRVM
ncbi:hypothetical protein FQN50_009559 [Emmonsiellopsis sp. PD_5]|nr:hypothetical protein FQN50_009559 [Emmonsiellopsis sp. PD_5]